jgi:hypothetical protein
MHTVCSRLLHNLLVPGVQVRLWVSVCDTSCYQPKLAQLSKPLLAASATAALCPPAPLHTPGRVSPLAGKAADGTLVLAGEAPAPLCASPAAGGLCRSCARHMCPLAGCSVTKISCLRRPPQSTFPMHTASLTLGGGGGGETNHFSGTRTSLKLEMSSPLSSVAPSARAKVGTPWPAQACARYRRCQ